MWERRIKFLQELIDSPVEVLGSTWPCLLFMLIITGVPVWLAFFVWFILLPFFMIDPAFFRRDTVGREKREGKDTSKQEAEYNRKVESLDKNGYIDEHQDF